MSDNNKALLYTDDLKKLANARVAVVYTEWNEKIIAALNDGFDATIASYKAEVVHRLAVPGCFELPFACKMLWEQYAELPDYPEAIVAFGAVIRGGTPHFDYVCKAVTEGILQLNMMLPVPVIFGVLTLDNEQQAWERLGGVHGHKGEEAAITALKMISVCRGVQQ